MWHLYIQFMVVGYLVNWSIHGQGWTFFMLCWWLSSFVFLLDGDWTFWPSNSREVCRCGVGICRHTAAARHISTHTNKPRRFNDHLNIFVKASPFQSTSPCISGGTNDISLLFMTDNCDGLELLCSINGTTAHWTEACVPGKQQGHMVEKAAARPRRLTS